MPEIVLIILVCLVASIFAGIGTGFVGMSAAVAITPILMGFLGMEQFEATAISLAADILASLVAAIIYGRNKNIDIKNGLVLLISILIFTVGGTIAARFVPAVYMGWGTVVTVLVMGCKLLFFPTNTKKNAGKQYSKRHQIIVSVCFGALIGFVCGFVGAGGGMMLLLTLTVMLGFELHKAVGTSVFVMTFSAMTGSVAHILTNQISDRPIGGELGDKFFFALGLCMIFTLIFSFIGSKIANKMNEKHLNLISGLMLLGIGTTVLFVGLIF